MHMCRIPYAVQFVWERKRRRRGETTQYNKEKKILTHARYPSRLTSGQKQLRMIDTQKF